MRLAPQLAACWEPPYLQARATVLAAVATRFSSFEYFCVAALGLTAGVFASGKRPLRAFVSLMLGLLLSTVGVDPTLGYSRFHFGSHTLIGGLGLYRGNDRPVWIL